MFKPWVPIGLAISALFLALACQSHQIEAQPSSRVSPPLSTMGQSKADLPQLVDIHTISPTIRLDIRYATDNNFTQSKLYSQARCLLRPTVARQLAQVQADLEPQGLGLKVFDCYRPLAVQQKLWNLLPDERYVANPKQGSRHNRGAAVDLTLVDRTGQELEMPSVFDDFSERSHLDYQGASTGAKQHRQLLQTVMQRRKFTGLATEWWHFDAQDWQQLPVLDTPLEAVPEPQVVSTPARP